MLGKTTAPRHQIDSANVAIDLEELTHSHILSFLGHQLHLSRMPSLHSSTRSTT